MVINCSKWREIPDPLELRWMLVVTHSCPRYTRFLLKERRAQISFKHAVTKHLCTRPLSFITTEYAGCTLNMRGKNCPLNKNLKNKKPQITIFIRLWVLTEKIFWARLVLSNDAKCKVNCRSIVNFLKDSWICCPCWLLSSVHGNSRNFIYSVNYFQLVGWWLEAQS